VPIKVHRPAVGARLQLGTLGQAHERFEDNDQGLRRFEAAGVHC
jgi:hypothetical protein